MKHLLSCIIFIFCTSILSFSQWYELNPETNSHIYCVHFSDNSLGWICANNNLIKQTADGGDTWNETNFHGGTSGSSGFNWYSIYAINENEVYACGSKYNWDRFQFNYAYSTNAGSSWTWQSSWGSSAGAWRQVFFIDDQIGWKVGTRSGNGWIGRTSDGFNEFIDSPVFDDQPLRSVHFIDQNIGWVAGSNGFIAKSIDAGITWTELQTGLEAEDLNKIFFIDATTGWAVGDEDDVGIIIKTTDGGATWNTVNMPPTMELNGLYFVNEDIGWACGSTVVNQEERGLILYSDDAGENWTEQYVADEVSELYDVFFINELTGWVSGSDGIILKTTNAGGTQFEGIEENPFTYSVVKYPNPFTLSIIFEYELKQPEKVSLTIFDNMGKQINFIQKNQFDGIQQIKWNAEIRPEGIYHYRIQAGKKAASGKILKIK